MEGVPRLLRKLRLDLVEPLLDAIEDGLEALLDVLDHPLQLRAEALGLRLELLPLLGQLAFEVPPAHLRLLEGENAEADSDVRRVLRDLGQVSHVVDLLSGHRRGVPRC